VRRGAGAKVRRGGEGDNFYSLQTPSGCSSFHSSPLNGCVFSSLFAKQRAIFGVRGTRMQRIKIIPLTAAPHFRACAKKLLKMW
jgi:hypothetical protein